MYTYKLRAHIIFYLCTRAPHQRFMHPIANKGMYVHYITGKSLRKELREIDLINWTSSKVLVKLSHLMPIIKFFIQFWRCKKDKKGYCKKKSVWIAKNKFYINEKCLYEIYIRTTASFCHEFRFVKEKGETNEIQPRSAGFTFTVVKIGNTVSCGFQI